MMRIYGNALSTIGRSSKKERKELIQAITATPLDTDIKAARATPTRHKFLAGSILEDLPAGALLKISMILCNDQNNPSKEAGISISASWRYTYGGENGVSIPQNIVVHVDQLYILTHVPSSHHLRLVFWKIAQDTLPQVQQRSHLQSTNIR